MIISRLLALPLLLAQCTTAPSTNQGSIFAAIDVAENSARQIAQAQKIEDSKNAGKPLIVDQVYVRGNSAGGQEPGIRFFNTSGKAIKYVTFNTIFYNAVGDKSTCSISGVSTGRLKFVGPLEHGSSKHEFWTPSIYYRGKCYMEIESVEIEFMDGTSRSLGRAAVDSLGAPEGWNTWQGLGRAESAQAARFGLSS